jgi:cobalt/nickel transport system permease protein
MLFPLLGVHLSDGVLLWPWYYGSIAVALALVFTTSRRLSDDEIPRIGILTAAFFIATYIRVPVGPTSVHLLLNSLVGIILGPRAVVAIAVGLGLQALLLGHGGFTALGINTLIISIPALLARPIFHRIVRNDGETQSINRAGFLAITYILHPLFMLPFLILTFISIRSGWRSRVTVEFRAGFMIGCFGVLATAALNATVLVVAGVEDWRIVAAIVFAAHIPIAFIEGFIVGFAVSFLKRVKPEMLG